MSNQPRRGRPPKVKEQGSDYSVTVKGKTYEFRKGEDGRLRTLGAPERDEDYNYARVQVLNTTGQV